MNRALWLVVLVGCSDNPCDPWREAVADTYEGCGLELGETCPDALMDDVVEQDQAQVDCVAACDQAATCEALDGSDPAGADALSQCQLGCRG